MDYLFNSFANGYKQHVILYMDGTESSAMEADTKNRPCASLYRDTGLSMAGMTVRYRLEKVTGRTSILKDLHGNPEMRIWT